ncbi:MAG: NADH-quinone oxidoreductase subunit NuoK [Candidatus Omnitrophica bacterium]|nr:NADH-quinone oxidoreductase subunit NuoK [Candidatus Omnitrophota bacterium]
MIIPVSHVLVVSALMFALGVYGALSRRNAIAILMSIELILNSANLNLIAFSRLWPGTAAAAQVTALIVIGIAAAGAVAGLALVLAVYRHRQTIAADEIHLLKG